MEKVIHGKPLAERMDISIDMRNAIHNFISGENFFRPMLELEREEYITRVKETLKFLLIPAFTSQEVI